MAELTRLLVVDSPKNVYFFIFYVLIYFLIFFFNF